MHFKGLRFHFKLTPSFYNASLIALSPGALKEREKVMVKKIDFCKCFNSVSTSSEQNEGSSATVAQ